ncbi:hypothetical protein NC653_022373 [Populus alba x Populus x berolinensis]|uniref:Uncharacterized protein n=1 Tax=Populus alba x Populus x berolinensis TaxID=444605 RepID=A0AAD6MES8_9ROSI|nr:hypothetical protein NC653_022373 [Populus alba x Populus x berolinensis]
MGFATKVVFEFLIRCLSRVVCSELAFVVEMCALQRICDSLPKLRVVCSEVAFIAAKRIGCNEVAFSAKIVALVEKQFSLLNYTACSEQIFAVDFYNRPPGIWYHRQDKNNPLVEAGVQEIGIDTKPELVTVKGTMDVKPLAETLKERLKIPVDIDGVHGAMQPEFEYMGQPVYGKVYVGQPVYAFTGTGLRVLYEFRHAPHQGVWLRACTSPGLLFGHAPHQCYRPVLAYPDAVV